MQPKKLVCYSNKPTKITYEIIDDNGTHLAEASADLRWINTLKAPPRTEQQQMAQAFIRLDLLEPKYEELSEDERETQQGPLKKWSMGGRPRTIGHSRDSATRRGNRHEPERLGSPIQFTTRIGRRNTPGKGLPSALTLIAHTTEEWEQLPFFRKGARSPSPPSNTPQSQDATQHLRLQWSPDPTEEKET
ncbi:hypothetical protein BDD12DRAFT_879065 [Trichophaea hybrida]|nr:hypothetical protein BDD12DRAFT_879065 [Trichophaea hybrida]